MFVYILFEKKNNIFERIKWKATVTIKTHSFTYFLFLTHTHTHMQFSWCFFFRLFACVFSFFVSTFTSLHFFSLLSSFSLIFVVIFSTPILLAQKKHQHTHTHTEKLGNFVFAFFYRICSTSICLLGLFGCWWCCCSRCSCELFVAVVIIPAFFDYICLLFLSAGISIRLKATQCRQRDRKKITRSS